MATLALVLVAIRLTVAQSSHRISDGALRLLLLLRKWGHMGNLFFEVIWLSCQSERLRTLAIKRGSLATQMR
jgi:hypothetical protein